jgi:hypothetical protein
MLTIFSDVIAFNPENQCKTELCFVAGINEVLCIKVGGIHNYHHVIITGIRLEGLTKKKK